MQCHRGLALALAGLVLPATLAQAQNAVEQLPPLPATRQVAAGARYQASGLHRLIFGKHYRDLWATPIEVDVLDLAGFGGGLTPVKRGGGQQTRSLRFKSGDGRQFTFRSVDKDPSVILPPELRGTVANDIVQDQISSSHPAGALVVPPLLEAAGVLHTEPRLVYLPDDTLLGDFRADFANTLGLFEERPTDGDADTPGFAAARKIINSDELFERVTRSSEDRVDELAFLRARLVDVFLGDWDRHRDQWRWALLEKEKPRLWMPIPRDRDQAFVRFDGLLLGIARGSAPQLVNFGSRYPAMVGLTWNGRQLDRRFLADVEKPVWDSMALDLQRRLTDSVIDAAVARLPLEYRALDAARLAKALKERRDRLPDAAEAFYRLLASDVDIHGTDGADLAVVTREADGITDVRLFSRREGESQGSPYFRRRFASRETGEIRLFLEGGDDSVAVEGPGNAAIKVRVIGGAGADVVADSASGKVKVYDTDPGTLIAGPASLDRKPWEPRVAPGDLPPRDWGSRFTPMFWGSSGSDAGLILGVGFSRTDYGFRQNGYASRQQLRAGYSTGASTFKVEYAGEFRRTNSGVRAMIMARASGIETVRFHGFGNETTAPGSSSFYRVKEYQYTLQPSLLVPLGSRLGLAFGPTATHTSTRFDGGRYIDTARPYGSGEFSLLGAQAALTLDTRDQPHAATRGLLLTGGGSFHPRVLSLASSFGEVHGSGSTWLTARALPLRPTLALRAGGKKIWGTYPYQEAAFIGGIETVRLGRENRFAGDASLYGNAELRFSLGGFRLLLPGQFGFFGLGDIGRVYLDGETSSQWHSAAGGGIWASFLTSANTMSLSVAKSAERTKIYFKAGFGI